MTSSHADLVEVVGAKLSDSVEFLALHDSADNDGNAFLSGALLPALRQVGDECGMRLHQVNYSVHNHRLFALVFTERKVTTEAKVTNYVKALTQRQLLAAVTNDCEQAHVGNESADISVVLCHVNLLRAALVRAVATALSTTCATPNSERSSNAIAVPRSVWRLLHERTDELPVAAPVTELDVGALMINLPDTHTAASSPRDCKPLVLQRYEFSDRLGDSRLCAAIARFAALQTFVRDRLRQGQQSSLLIGWLYNLVRLYEQAAPGGAGADELVRQCAEAHISSQMQASHFGRGRRNAIDPDSLQDMVDAVALIAKNGAEQCGSLALRLENAHLSNALACHQLTEQSALERRLAAAIVQASHATMIAAERYCVNVQLPWHGKCLARLKASTPTEWCVLRIETAGTGAGAFNERRTPLALLTALRSALPTARDGIDYLLLTSSLSYDNLHHWQMTDDREQRQRELRGILARGPKCENDPKFERSAAEALETTHKFRHPVPWMADVAPKANAACALVVLNEAQRLALQVACAAALCAQRALGLEESQCRVVRPLAGPLLADTLANSDDLGALCHALNALSAQLGLAADAWCPHSARAQSDALRTARLCVRVADVLLPHRDPSATIADAAVTSVFETLERTRRKSAPVEEDNSLIGALQVVLAGNLFPLVVPDELAAQTAALLPQLASALGRRPADESDGSAGSGPAIIDCACGGAGVAVCERLKLAVPQAAANHGAACCICDLERVCAPHGQGPLTDFLCSHCITRVSWTMQPALRSVWVDVARGDSAVDVLQYIDAVVARAETRSEVSVICRQLLLRMRSRVGRWVSSTGAPRVYKNTLAAHPHTASHATINRSLVQFVDDYLTARTELAHLPATKVMKDKLHETKAGGRLSAILEATYGAIGNPVTAAAQPPADAATGFALGLCMSVLEVVQAWYLEPLTALARLRSELGCTGERAAAITSYLVPFETRERFNAYVATQRAGLLFPLIDSAIIEPSVCGTAGSNTALNDSRSPIDARFERLLDAGLRPRPLTGTLPNMLETILINWHAGQ
jgi:hypothetical protein